MKILVTGGTGFVGSHLSASLCKDHDLIVLSRSGHENISDILSKVTLEKCDISDRTSLDGIIERHRPDAIIHLASCTSHARSFDDPVNDLEINTKSTLYMLEKIRSLNLECRFVLGSTFVVIGKPESLPVTEESSCNPTTIYGSHKLASENYCKIYSNVYGMNTGIFRITNSFGPRESIDPKKNAINYLIHEASKGNDITIFNQGDYFRDLIYIDDVVSGIRAVTEKGSPGELYWISSFEKTWFRDLGEMLESLTNADVKYTESSEYTKKVDVGSFLADNSKLRSLGWEKKWDLREGMLETIKYLRSHESP